MTHLTGYNLIVADKEKMDKVIRVHVLTSGRRQLSIPEAFDALIRKYYSQSTSEGPVALPPNQRPSFDQFRFRVRKLSGSSEAVEQRSGSLVYRQRHRPALQSPGLDLPGPGSVYQIDATQLDISLVSGFDSRTPIGRPWAYMVRDWWSRCIVAILVSLAAPSQANAAIALQIAAGGQLELFKKLGFPELARVWPRGGLCSLILADRGELLGNQPDSWCTRLAVGIANLPPRAPDWKGVVEQGFASANREALVGLPGAQLVGDRERRLSPTEPSLTPRDLWHILLLGVQKLNARVVPSDQLDSLAAVAAERPFTYYELFEWGQARWGSPLRAWDDELLRLRFFPVSEVLDGGTRGISLNGLRYYSDEGLRAGLFLRGTGRGRDRILASWNPLEVAEAYALDPRGQPPVPLRLVRKHQKYEGLSVAECTRVRAVLRSEELTDTEESLNVSLQADAAIQRIVRRSRENKRAADDAIPQLSLLEPRRDTAVTASPENALAALFREAARLPHPDPAGDE